MHTNHLGLLLQKVPDSVADHARALGITDASCLLSVRSDLDPDGTVREVWMIVGREQVITLAPDAPQGDPVTGPFRLDAVEKVRSFQTVGSAFLQLMIDGVYVNVIRYSNARREAFGRVRIQLERVTTREPLQEDALEQPSETTCQICGLPLPGRKATCPKCGGHHGIFFRSLGLMRPYWKSIAFLLLMMLLGVGLDLIPPQLTRVLVDRVLTPREHIDWLPMILLGLVAASALRCVLNVLIGRISSIVGTRITKELRERLMLVLGVGAMLFTMDWHLALLVLLPIPFVVIGTIFFWKRIYPRYYRFWDSQSKMAQVLSGLLSGVRLVKSFGQEDRERQRFGQYAGYMQVSRRSLEIGSATFGLGGLIIWYAGGRLVLETRMTLGTLMAFFGYLGMFYAPISALSMFSNWVTGFLSAGQRIFEVLDSEAVLPVAKKPLRLPKMNGGIEFRNVTFGYDPYTPVLKNISFKIDPGQFIGIVGKSGSGKTTLVNLICRFYDVQQGQVLIDGVDVREIDPDDLHQQIGLVLQESFLFRGSIAENIAYGRPDSPPLAIMDAARAANAHLFITRRASAYDTKLGEHGAGLSGGERQRISIARALLCDPRVLILDEATSSVDTESEQEIQKALFHLCKGRTTIAIAHRLSTLKNSDHIIVIDDGRIAESGSHEQLMTMENGVYRKLVRIQTELTRLEL